MEIKAYVTNLGLYNAGYLVGEWVTFPIDEDEMQELMERIKIDEFHEEMFITDYETDLDIKISEYTSISELNRIAETFDALTDSDAEIVEALMNDGCTLEQAIDKKDNCIIHYGCEDMADVAERDLDDSGVLDSLPKELRYYFDFEALGRDMESSGTYYFTSSGNCIEVCY